MKNINALIRISYEMYLKCKTQSLPADPYSIARQLDIVIKEAKTTDEPHYSAMGNDVSLLAWEKDRYCIYLKSQNGGTRNPIFHEIAHAQLKHLYDKPPQEDEANLLMMIHLVPPIFLHMYKGDKLGFVQMLSGVTMAEAKKYLLIIKELGYRNSKTSLDHQMLLQFEEYIRTAIRPSQIKRVVQVTAYSLMLAIGILIGSVIGFGHNPPGDVITQETPPVSDIYRAPPVISTTPSLAVTASPPVVLGDDPGISDDISRTVYITPTGTKYHYSPTCAGVSAVELTLEKALALKKSPCTKCVFDPDD